MLSPDEMHIARPTFGAAVSIEAEHGPLLDVAESAFDPSRATLRIIGGSLQAWIAAGPSGQSGPSREVIEACATSGRLADMLLDVQALVWSYFHTGRKNEESSGDTDASDRSAGREFQWRDYVGSAIGLWGLSPDEAWGMTVPEWWAACDTYARANGAGRHDGPTPMLSREKARELAAENRAEIRAEMQKQWERERGSR